MASTNILTLLIILLFHHWTIGAVRNKCEYDLIKSSSKHSLSLSVDAELVYRLYKAQNGCFINVDEIYKNLTTLIRVNRTQIYISLGFFCESSTERSDIHFTSLNNSWNYDDLGISVQVILAVCTIYMDELTHFQQYGHIWSVVTTNASHIHPGVSCSSLKYLRMLSSSLPCTEDKENNTKLSSNAFFWEVCDPFEELFNLRIQGCETNPYEIKHAFIQTKFPKLQTLWLKYMDLSLSDLTFPWSNIFIDSSDLDIIKYLSYYKESKTFDNNTIARSINIYDSAVSFGSDFNFLGYINKIVVNNVKIQKLDTIFQHVRGVVDMDLSNNEIEEVDRHVFLMQMKLMRLNLANNKLITLPEELFDKLHNLLYLDISTNRISQVHQRHFKHLLKLKELNLQNNDITTLPNDFLGTQINSIQYLFLSRNPLKTLPLNAFYAPNVLLVDMRYCQMNSSSLLWVLDNINLYEMQTSYSESLVSQPSHIRTIDLSKNRIENIPINLWQTAAVTKFKSIIQSFYINLDDNPLDCTCKIILTATLAELYINQGVYIDWKCQFPSEFRGRLISTIKPEETYCSADIKYCPVHCKCSTVFGTKAFIPDTERTFIIDCRNINMTFLPMVMPTGRLKLWFRNSSLIEIAPRYYLKNTIFLDVSYNRINQIAYDTAIALNNVSTVKIDHNNLTSLPEQLASMNMSSVTLSRNPFICDCKLKWMKYWLLLRTNPVKDWKDIECTYNVSRIGQLISLQDSVFVCREHSGNIRLHEHIIFASIVIGSVLFVLVSLSLLVIFNRFTLKVLLYLYCGFRPFDKPSYKSENASYDVFVLYSYTDRVFIQHNLIERLKSKEFRVVDFYKDLFVGFSFLQNIETFIKRSKRVIFCWTIDMLQQDLLISAWNMAYERAVKHDLDLLILVVDSDLNTSSCTNNTLVSFLKRGRYIKKHTKYMFAKIDYLIQRTKSNKKRDLPTNEYVDEESDIPMLTTVSSTVTDHENDLVYISYPEDLDHEIRRELIPYLVKERINIKVLEHDFTPGADIREEIHTKLDNSIHFIFIVSNSVLNDDVKMFILSTVMSKSKLRIKNYLLMFTSGPLLDTNCVNELSNYFNNFVTGSTRDENFRNRLLQALRQEI